jgi:hypothetical protein
MGKFTSNSGALAGNKSKRGEGVKTQQWSELSETILGEHTQRFNMVLRSMPDKDFVTAYLQPKLNSNQSLNTNTMPAEIVIQTREPEAVKKLIDKLRSE